MRKRSVNRSISLILLILIAHVTWLAAQSEQKIELVIETGNSSLPNSVIFSPDGKLLASGGVNYSIALWDAETGQYLKVLEGHTGHIRSVAFSPDGSILASGSGDKTIKLWNVQNGRLIRTLEGHADGVMSVAFLPDGMTVASGSEDATIKLWNIENGQQIKTLEGYSSRVWSIAISPEGTLLASGNENQTIKLWNIKSGQIVRSLDDHAGFVNSVDFSPDGKTLASSSSDATVKLWNVRTGEVIATLRGHAHSTTSVAFSTDGKMLASAGSDMTIKLWNVESGQLITTLRGHNSSLTSLAFSSDGKTLASASYDLTIKLWSVARRQPVRSLEGHVDMVSSVAFSPDGRTIAGGFTSTALWSLETGQQRRLEVDNPTLLAFSPDGKILRTVSSEGTIKFWDVDSRRLLESRVNPSYRTARAFSFDGRMIACETVETKARVGENYEITNITIDLWEVETGRIAKTLEAREGFSSLAFSADGKILASVRWDGIIRFWDIETGQTIKVFRHIYDSPPRVIAFSPDGEMLAVGDNGKTILLFKTNNGQLIDSLEGHSSWINSLAFSKDGRVLISGSADATLRLWDLEKKTLSASLISLDKDDWIVTTPEGRFDTNKSLDRIEGLHWTVNDEILKPLPLDVFMRQYYEPGLLQRVLKCTEENNCNKEFNPLPPIAEINRVQPKVAIKEIKSSANLTGSVDLTVEVENVTEEVSISATDGTKKRRLSSGAFDLRLFRDGQLVGVSTPKDKLAALIGNAPRLIAETKASGKLIDTPEDRAWREANDLSRLKSENIKVISPDKIRYTFRDLKLPQDGRKEVQFTAYAFNSDRVKSTTTEPFKFTVPAAVASAPKKGRAFLISVGVNASENPAYHLRYAVNDARKMQEIVGVRLKADKDKYSEVIQIPMISEYGANKKLTENTAQKALIKGVFSLLAGHEEEVPPDVLKRIPSRDKIKPVQPEDTLIITYSGHGYADQSGIFYLLPYDIGANTTKLTPEALKRMISSDEFSLWMQEITAAEMIMIIDACHSSAAVQGDGFKPAPMGSRGLGQLAYDKKMKILSATQADNVALELNRLEQGLLSYALVEDGIKNALADTDKNKQLSATEWLSFGEARVPQLYQEIREGKRGVIIDGRKRDTLDSDFKLQVNPKLQSPHLFDFRRNISKAALFNLP